jgi:hypothetical protein
VDFWLEDHFAEAQQDPEVEVGSTGIGLQIEAPTGAGNAGS